MMRIPLTFRTARTAAHAGWQRFWLSRDAFLAAMLRRPSRTSAFATYTSPALTEPIRVPLVPDDLRHHGLILGATGAGKSSLLEALARAHLPLRHGLALVDLHGDLFQRTAAWALAAPRRDVWLLDFTRPALLPGWNPLARLPDVDVGRHVDLLVGVLKRLYADEAAASWAWGVKVEEILRHTLRACLESEVPTTLLDVRRFLLIPTFRAEVLESVETDTRAYFLDRFGKREEMYVSAVTNKLDPFLSSPAVQRFLGQPTSSLDLLNSLTGNKVILINLAKGYLGPTADVIGRLLVNVFHLAALRRTARPWRARTPFSLLLDEAHNLTGAGSGLEDLLVAARKYRVYVTLAAQSLSLFPARFRPHVLGNTSRQWFFRLPASEARALGDDLFEPQGARYRTAIRPTDRLDDPLLSPTEERARFLDDLANLPTGACIWALKAQRYKARRIQVLPPDPVPFRRRDLLARIEKAMLTRRRLVPGDDPGDLPF